MRRQGVARAAPTAPCPSPRARSRAGGRRPPRRTVANASTSIVVRVRAGPLSRLLRREVHLLAAVAGPPGLATRQDESRGRRDLRATARARGGTTSKTTGMPRRSASASTGSSGQRSSFSSTSRPAAPGERRRSRRRTARMPRGDRLRRNRREGRSCASGRARSALSSRSWYSSSAIAAATTSGRSRREHGVLPRVRREPHPARAHQRPELREARLELLPPRDSFAACDPNGIEVRCQAEDLRSPCSSFQRRIASSASRFALDQLRRPLGRDVREPQRPRRGRELSVDARVADARATVALLARGAAARHRSAGGVVERVSGSGTSPPQALVVGHGRVPEAFDERPCDARVHRRDEVQPVATRAEASGPAPRRSAALAAERGRCARSSRGTS